MRKEITWRRIFLGAVLCFLLPGTFFFLLPAGATAQSGEPEVTGDSGDHREEREEIPEDPDLVIEEITETISSGVLGFRINYGPRLGVLKLNMQSINQFLGENDFPQLSSELPIRARGGRAGFHFGTRLGWMRYEGSKEAIYQDRAEGIFRKSKIDIFWRGLFYEKNVYNEQNKDLILGGLLGRGAASLNFVFSSPPELRLDSGHQILLEYKFWALQPFISFQQRLSRLVDVELTAGYFLTTSSPGWQFAGQEIKTPFADLRGPILAVGINFGF